MPTGNDQYRVNQILRVAKLYYELHLSQIEIARREHLSKSTVSRLIKAALDMGMVQIAIVEPKHSFTAVEDALTARFGLKKATVLPDVVGNRDILRRDICAALAEDLGRVVANGSVVGVAWGNTMSTLGKVLSKTDRQGVSVIQLNGGLSKALYETGTAAVVRDFVDALNAEGYLLPAPALVDTPAIADAIKSDSSMNRILTLAARCDVAVYSVAAGGGALILEKFVTAARHIETQCARDGHGAFAVVSTRDCTLQRRNQKLLEEAPAPYLPEGLDARLTGASRRLLEAVDYVGVATCEFLLTPDGDLWFLEVNPRLQVEHCVSEEVTGVDLVEVQLRIAVGGRLGEIPAPRGHSVELRITCEDPARSLAPSTGAITRLRWPAGPGVRIESGVVEGDVVTPVFDPMLAKIVVTGADRDQALRRARRALHETVVEGVTVCTALHEHVLGREEFTAADPRGGLGVTTRWIETQVLPALAAPTDRKSVV